MRELVIARLRELIDLTEGYGIPRYFDCEEGEHITDTTELTNMSNTELLELLETAVGFQG